MNKLMRPVDGIFQTTQGNPFRAWSNVFVSALLGFVGNSFGVEPTDGSTPYGVMIATRAAATANAATNFGDESIPHFLTREGGFSGAANQVFTQSRSTLRRGVSGIYA